MVRRENGRSRSGGGRPWFPFSPPCLCLGPLSIRLAVTAHEALAKLPQQFP